MARVLITVIVLLVAVTLYGLLDCATREREKIKVLPKWAWLLVILCIPVLGLVLWFAFGRHNLTVFEPKPEPAPDDDPDFLRKLNDEIEQQMRRERRERGEDEEQ